MDAAETINGRARTAPQTVSVESRASWAVALTALGIYTVSFGAPTITVVALKPIAADLGSARSVPALAFALAWFGAAAGGIAMGWLADRIGIRWVVIGGALMIAVGLVLSSLGARRRRSVSGMASLSASSAMPGSTRRSTSMSRAGSTEDAAARWRLSRPGCISPARSGRPRSSA
jgi:MFS family permease